MRTNATINMAGAAVTIAVLSLAAAHTVGLQVSFFQAFLLAIIAAFAACGTSGVAGGSLLLIPLACSLFNIDYDIAMQVVAVGFIIGVVQDSVETALPLPYLSLHLREWLCYKGLFLCQAFRKGLNSRGYLPLMNG